MPCIVTIAQSGSSSALENAVSAVGALVVHRTSKDPRLVHDATLMYSRAISHARRELAGQLDRRSMIATAHFLSLYELFYRVSLDETGARPHSFWFLFLTKPNQEEPIDESMRVLLDSNMRLFAMMETLVSRKCPFAIGSLVDKSQHQICRASTPATFTNLGLMVANAIEASDVMCEPDSDPDMAEILNLLEEIVRLEGMLHDWMTDYNKRISHVPYWLTAVHLSYPKVRGTSCLFRHLYEFPNFHTTVIYACYWMCLLGLAQALNHIVRIHYCKIDAEIKERIRPKLAADEHADSLCMTIPFLGRPQHFWAGRITAVRPLNMLYDYYKHAKNWPKLAWCVYCAEDLGSLRVPAIKPP